MISALKINKSKEKLEPKTKMQMWVTIHFQMARKCKIK